MPRVMRSSLPSQTAYEHTNMTGDLQLTDPRKHREQGKKLIASQSLGAAKDAVRMARIAKFYEQLPKGSAPPVKATGLLGRYQARYFGKNPSAAREQYSVYFVGCCVLTL
jgi:hypothetical protein